MVKAFYDNNAGMVVGTYMLTDIDMNMIPPGVIDHKGVDSRNGRNNALRINGLGAPRAFYTPMLREIHVPNTSYGEDYALGLNFAPPPDRPSIRRGIFLPSLGRQLRRRPRHQQNERQQPL